MVNGEWNSNSQFHSLYHSLFTAKRRMPMELHVSNTRVPGSNPGGSNVVYWAIAQMVERAFHQTLSSQFYVYFYGHRKLHYGCSVQTERLHRVSRRTGVGGAASGKGN